MIISKKTIIILFALVFLTCRGTGKLGLTAKQFAESEVTPTEGGTIQLVNDVTFAVPDGSLSKSIDISIEKSQVPSSVTGVPSGFQDIGIAYKFKPAGTKFNLAKPARMIWKIDNEAIRKKDLDPRTVQMFYFDEKNNRYVNIEGNADGNGNLVSMVEHFTIYLPLARSLLSGNNAPVINFQSTIPAEARGNAPLYVRATVRDFDVGGSVAGVWLNYRASQASTSFTKVIMQREVRNNSINTYGFLIPSGALAVANLGTGADLEYFIEAVDNLNIKRTTATSSIDIVNIMQPGSLTISPANINITAGFERNFQVDALDANNNSFSVLAETYSVSDNIGTINNQQAGGLLFSAQKVFPGNLQVGVGTESAQANITVFNGMVDRLAVLDQNFVPVTNIEIDLGSSYNFDVFGYDEFNNTILVIPDWLVTPSLGSINNDGVFTASGSGSGQITVTLGGVQQIVNVTVVNAEMQITANSTGIASGGSFNFGTDFTNNNLSAITFTITNSGNKPMTFSSSPVIIKSGTDASDFIVAQPSGADLAAGASRDFTIDFIPTTVGNKSAQIVIANNSNATPAYTINLNGIAAVFAPEINITESGSSILSGGSISYSDTLLGSTTDIVITIENLGYAPLTISSVTLISGDVGDFSVGAIPGSVAGLDVTTGVVTLTFQPQSVGLKSAVLEIISNDANESNYTITLSGTGTVPPPWSLEFSFSSNYSELVVIDSQTLIAFSGSDVLKSIDAGSTWTTKHTLVNVGTAIDSNKNNSILWAVYRSFASGDFAVISSDDGQTWSTITLPLTNEARSIDFLDANIGILVGNGGNIYRTTDGGTNWSTINAPHSNAFSYYKVRFLDANVAIAVGSSSATIRSVDAGLTWSATSGGISYMGKLTILDINTAYATSTAQGPYLIKTSDGGISWQSVNIVPFNLTASTDIAVTLSGKIYILMSGSNLVKELQRSLDGGQTWQSFPVPSGNFKKMEFFNEQLGWLVGDEIIKTTTGGE